MPPPYPDDAPGFCASGDGHDLLPGHVAPVNDDVRSPAARSATRATAELDEPSSQHTSPLHAPPMAKPDERPAAQPDSTTAFHQSIPTWTVASSQERRSPASEPEVDELMDDDAAVVEGGQQTASSPGAAQSTAPAASSIARPAAAILRALGPPMGTYPRYTSLREFFGPPDARPIRASTLPPQPEASASRDAERVDQHSDREPVQVQFRVPEPINDDAQSPTILPTNVAPVHVVAPPDPVIRFLREIGLSASYADALRHVGFSDDDRIRAVGGLKGAPMTRIEKSLEEVGFDLVARVLIREGLKQRFAQGSK